MGRRIGSGRSLPDPARGAAGRELERQMTIGRTDTREQAAGSNGRLQAAPLFGCSCAEPIWASGHEPHHTGRTHDRSRTASNVAQDLDQTGPSTHGPHEGQSPSNPILKVKGSGASGQGYRIWPSTVRANSLVHPDRFRLRRMEMSGRADRSTLRASLRSVVRFSGPWSRRLRARSSSKQVSSTQCRPFSICQCARACHR